jgi:hypothetical protein
MKREFVINRHGKDYVLYAGLLDAAHQQGLRSIKTELVQVPSAQNGSTAICIAEVTTERGTFTGIGDADPSNVNRAMVNALIRMAETRAKARALRDAVNVAMVVLEELPESAPEMLLPDDSAEVSAAAAAVASTPSASVSAGRPAPIVSLSSVRQQAAATHASAESNGAPAAAPPVAGTGSGPASAEPVRLPAARTTTRGASGSKGAPDGPPLPATPTQLETIAKLARSVGRAVSAEGLTRAAASELITRLSEERYGARRAP